jgi:hypothetical protein
VKLDSSGNPIWQQVYPGYGDTIAHSIVQTSDGGYIFAGTMYLDNDPNIGTKYGLTDIWGVKLDPTGNIQWSKLLGGDGWDFTSFWTDDTIQQTTDGGYVVIGSTTSDSEGDVGPNHGSGDVWVVKLDNTGNITWQNPLGGTDTDLGMSISQTPDNGYIFAGVTYSDNSGDVGPSYGNGDYWVGKLDPNGNLQWQLPLGGSAYDQAESIQPTSDGGYIVSGRSYSSNSGVVVEQNHGDSDAWVVKLTPRFVVNVIDSDTGDPIQNANVGLHDYQYNNWSYQTSSVNPIVFNGSVGSNPFDFTDGSVFGLSVSANGYPYLDENVTFRINASTITVALTSGTRPSLPHTYSMTDVPDLMHLSEGESVTNNVSYWLGQKAGWGLVFSHEEDNVTKADFGINEYGYRGLDSATFHWHIGHGGYNSSDPYGRDTGIVLQSDNNYPPTWYTLLPIEVQKKWGGDNKWIVLDSCFLLGDPRWGNALQTTHGIFGFTTETEADPSLASEFFSHAIDGRETLVNAYINATRHEFHDTPVCADPPQCDKKTNIIAAVRFTTEDQLLNDHLPGYGSVEPDEDPNNDTTYFYPRSS